MTGGIIQGSDFVFSREQRLKNRIINAVESVLFRPGAGVQYIDAVEVHPGNTENDPIRVVYKGAGRTFPRNQRSAAETYLYDLVQANRATAVVEANTPKLGGDIAGKVGP